MAVTNIATDIQAVSDAIHCPICLEVFRNPKSLPCAHTFCLDCLEQSGQSWIKSKGQSCAICRQEYALPQDGFKALPNNSLVEPMLVIMRNLKVLTQPTELYCDRCCADGDTEAILHCLECNKNLCNACKGMPTSASFSKREEKGKSASDVDTKIEEKVCMHKIILPYIQGNKCERHEDQQLEFYCNDCKETACRKCSQAKHNCHKVDDVNKLSEFLKTNLKEAEVKITEYIAAATKELAILDEHKENFQKVVAEAREKIDEKCEKLKELAEMQRKCLLENLEILNEARLNKLDERKDKVKEHIRILESFTKFSKELVDKHSASAVCRYTGKVVSCATAIEKLQDDFELGQLGVADIVLTFTDLVNVADPDLKVLNLIGSVALNEAKDADVRAPVYARIWKYSLFLGYRSAMFNTKSDNQLDILKLIFSKQFNFEELNMYGYNILHSTVFYEEAPFVAALIDQLKEKGVNFTKMLNERSHYRNDDMIFLVRGKDKDRPAWHYVEVNRDLLAIFQKKSNGGTIDVAKYGKILKSGWGKDPDDATKEAMDNLYKLESDHLQPDQTPLQIAVFKNKPEVACILINNGADLNIGDKFGMTPLHYAAMRGNMELAELLLVKGADTRAVNYWHRTAVDVADMNEHYDISAKIISTWFRELDLD